MKQESQVENRWKSSNYHFSEKIAPKLRRTKLPERRDTFTRKFEQKNVWKKFIIVRSYSFFFSTWKNIFFITLSKSQKEAKNGMEKVFTRGSQRASQLLIDLQISMASNGYGKLRNFQYWALTPHHNFWKSNKLLRNCTLVLTE